MVLFSRLDDDFFSIFSGSNRHIYEHTILDQYAVYFSGASGFPTRNEVVSRIVKLLSDKQDLWLENEELLDFAQLHVSGRRLRRRLSKKSDRTTKNTSLALARARHIYTRLVNSGWLEEEVRGLDRRVDMPMAPMMLARFLAKLKEGFASNFAGIIAEVRNTIHGVALHAFDNGIALQKAAADVEEFSRNLRGLYSGFREIAKSISKAPDRRTRLNIFFDDYLKELFLKDFRILSSGSHPYRFRNEILEELDDLFYDSQAIRDIGRAYVANEFSPVLETATEDVLKDIARIRSGFFLIEETLENIQARRQGLDRRLQSMVRFASRTAGEFELRSSRIILELDTFLSETPDLQHDILAPSFLDDRQTLLAPELIKTPTVARQRVRPAATEAPEVDPIDELRQELETAYFDRIYPSSAEVLAYLDLNIPPGVTVSMADLPFNTVDDFIFFEALREICAYQYDLATPLVSDILPFYDLSFSNERMENDWVKTNKFLIRRRTAKEQLHVS